MDEISSRNLRSHPTVRSVGGGQVAKIQGSHEFGTRGVEVQKLDALSREWRGYERI
jgi:hypothetical protein